MKKDEWVTLCIAKTAYDITVPIAIPHGMNADVGDIVYFRLEGVEKMGDVIFCEDYQKVENTTWNALTAAFGMPPVKATKIARICECNWEEKDGQDQSDE